MFQWGQDRLSLNVARLPATRTPATTMAASYEILPGERIGPFRLGMTREQVRDIAQRDLGTPWRDIETSKFGLAAECDRDEIGDTGLSVDYDKNGRANRVWACWGPARSTFDTTDSTFVLFGNRINGLEGKEVIQLSKDYWSDVENGHFSIDVPSAGLSFTYWENATDGEVCAVTVLPPVS
jgi:hypothetical protein